MKTEEHVEQVRLMQWWHLQCNAFGVLEELLFAIPNGGLRNAITAARLKDEGVRAGVPDLFLAYPGKYGGRGLFIEMKKQNGGRLSNMQSSMLYNLASVGFHVAVCHGWIEAKYAIEAYLRGDFSKFEGPKKAHLN